MTGPTANGIQPNIIEVSRFAGIRDGNDVEEKLAHRSTNPGPVQAEPDPKHPLARCSRVICQRPQWQ